MLSHIIQEASDSTKIPHCLLRKLPLFCRTSCSLFIVGEGVQLVKNGNYSHLR